VSTEDIILKCTVCMCVCVCMCVETEGADDDAEEEGEKNKGKEKRRRRGGREGRGVEDSVRMGVWVCVYVGVWVGVSAGRCDSQYSMACTTRPAVSPPSPPPNRVKVLPT
jgi:hypothetical protein